ncbi:uncharacterized protein Z518_00387 [Rhinocladiella mackenziei CBS 650.93]|uniref:Rhinocladiella mackenziei CBS 650.93 unplaced genomic scaffold supercont1.1, whole genome shotgun sequence n=1 Tax=Rhinocladiella mackenziei CBS 650.93 TaxID=1442369 RepID=A0A0D2HF28_9EURO|nr:uncharacterized protein Z518_00387 [Rhinocladiella mackenziei CBS 650.93]KIX09308.1 hypothetical protein Z518_00387 [Rhinocladiella mackenziei CBS 650.93]
MQQWNENPNPPLNMLNEPWGLEFSLYTGVARRVPLRALLDETVVSYLQTIITTPLLDADLIEGIGHASSDDAASRIYNHIARTVEGHRPRYQIG